MANRADILIRILGESAGLKSELNKSSGDVQKFSRDVEQSGQRLSAFGNIVQGIFQGIGQAAFNTLANGVRRAVTGIGEAVKAASDLNESLNKVNVAFADSAQEILDWSKDSAAAFGQSRGDALEAASSFGLLFRTMGVTSEASADMSIRLTELASDLASINNISPEEALIKLRAGLVGEAEPLRTVGVLLNAATVEQKALALGLADTTSSLTEQDKVLARYQLILDQTTLAQGDFARTSDELANAQRILAAQFEDSSARFGQALLPLQLAFTRGLSELITAVEPYGLNIMDSLASGLAKGIVAILPVLQQVRALFTYWLKPGSPPRLLRELTDWGTSAMQEYLRGWTLADFDALRSVGGLIEDVVRSFAGTGDIAEADLVSRVFGTQHAIVDAINEWRIAGNVSTGTLENIRRAAGPAGDSVAALVSAYADMERAANKASEAQRGLDQVTRRYDATLSPLQRQLEGIRDAQQRIRDDQRLVDLGKVVADPTADAADRRQARLEQEQIQLQRQIGSIEDERDAAIDAEQKKVDAAKKEEAAQQQKYQVAQEALKQQSQTNALIKEEIDFRERLASEALAAQEKAIRELEAAQRESEQAERARRAELDRITDAQLRYRLASTDTAGQLAIMRDELSKVAEGSADYYNILTTIIGLEERLQKERDKNSGGLLPAIDQVVGTPAQIEQTSKGIQELSDALEKAFAALSGADGQTVELSPAWQGFADTLGTIGEAAKIVAPIIGDIINLVLGKDVEGVEVGADPFGDNWWLAGLIPGLQSLINNLIAIKDGDWAKVWNNFQQFVFDMLNAIDPESDPRGFTIYSWLQDIVIPALQALAAGDWKSAITLFSIPINDLIDSAYQNGYDFVTKWWQGIVDGLKQLPADWQEYFRQQLREDGFLVPSPINPDKTRPGGQPGQDYIPPNNFSSLPGVSPQLPATASLAASSNINSGNTTLGPFYVSVGGTGRVDESSGRAVASGIDQELRRRGWAPT